MCLPPRDSTCTAKEGISLFRLLQITRIEMHDINKVCCIVKFDGFAVRNKYLVREFAWIDMGSGEKSSFHFDLRPYNKELTQKDNSTIYFNSNKLHGLSFTPQVAREKLFEYKELNDKLMEIYEKCKDGEKDIVGYKGGNAEKELLVKLKIPNRNLEEFGCRKYPELRKYHNTSSCGLHKNNLPCSLSQIQAFRSWVLDNKHEFTD